MSQTLSLVLFFVAFNQLAIGMFNKYLISLNDLNVAATGVASIRSTICDLYITCVYSDAIIYEFLELLMACLKSIDSNSTV